MPGVNHTGAAPIRWMGPIRNLCWEQKRTEGYVIVSSVWRILYLKKKKILYLKKKKKCSKALFKDDT